MISRIKEFLRLKNLVYAINERLNYYVKENQSLSGKVRLLEEQHEIMHNFLVEINKYLINFADNKEKQNDLPENRDKAKKKGK